MGHIRLGTIPKSQRWAAIVAQLATAQPATGLGAGNFLGDIDNIADRSMEAAQGGLQKVIDDPGVRYTFYLLTQVVLAARNDDWLERLENLGIAVPPDGGLFDLTAGIQYAIDDYVDRNGYPTDFSEMAQQAAGEAITALAGPRAVTLFGSGMTEVRLAVRTLSTKTGFSRFGQTFFGRFMSRYLNFFLSRVTAASLNGHRLNQLGDVTEFNRLLQWHCEQSARIVYDFSGEWYSKTNFREGINLDNTSGFVAVAIKKLRAELQHQQAEA